jgi:hypothetical protein
MSTTQKTISVPVWHEGGVLENTGKIIYGMVYDEITHYPCFQIKAYIATRKKGQTVDWKYVECDAYDFVDDKASHLLELLQFDGWLSSGIPVDYHANALYFYKRFREWFRIAGKTLKSQKHPHWVLFCDITLFGSLSDSNEVLPTIDSEKELYVLSQWLKEREPKLRAKFNAMMRKHEIG